MFIFVDTLILEKLKIILLLYYWYVSKFFGKKFNELILLLIKKNISWLSYF